MNDRKDTALGVARARFVEGLARKSAELRGAVALLVATPGGDRPREEMRRRLHALYASAQVFRIDALADALKEGIQRLDAARDQKRALAQDDLDGLAELAARLQGLGAGEASARPSRPPAPASSPPPDAARVRAGKGTLLGMAMPAPKEPVATAPLREHKGTIQGMQSAQPQPLPHATAPGRTQKGTLEGYGQPSSRPGLEVADDDDSTTIPGTVTVPRAAALPTMEPATRPSAPRAAKPSGSFTAARIPSEIPPPVSSAAATPFVGTVISVLVVDGAEAQAQVRGLLPPERYEVLAAADPEEALRLARSTAPDVVLADRGTLARAGLDFASRLRGDALTDFVPIILLVPSATPIDPVAVRELGADDALTKPLDGAKLERAIARATGLGGDGGLSTTALGELTVEEIAQRVSDEVREGIVRSAQDGKDFKVPLGEGSDVLAAAWSAIARLRTVVSARSGGRVKFRDEPRRGGPALLALAPEEDALAADSSTEVSLAGRHVLVVDDDPGIVWFFAGLLREAGAEVTEAADGREALTKLRHRRVDVVISDILMPVLDGLALCREISRDPALDGTPVILLSWKEDLLTRMRELQAGASGYLRKESGAPQILARVREVLRPRARIEAQLRTGGELRGSVERVGILNLLRTVAAERPDARVTVRDALHLFEADLRGGQLVHLTRTSTDGSFGRGKSALLQLLGVNAGRFTVVSSDAPVRPMFQGDLDRVLEEASARLGALVDSVSGTGLVQASSIELDEDALATWTASALGTAGTIASHLAKGESPRALIGQGAVAPQALESVLVDLARRGVLRGVKGPGGEDRVAEAFRLRMEEPGRAVGSDLTPAPPPRAPVDELDEPMPTATPASSEGLEWLGVEESTGDVVRATGRMVADAARRDSSRPPDPDAGPSTDELDVTDLESVSSRPPPRAHADDAPVLALEVAKSPKAVGASEPALELDPKPSPKRTPTLQPAAARLAPPQPMADEEGGSPLVWAIVIVALVLVGFFGYRAYVDGTTFRLFGFGPRTLMEHPVPTPPPARDAGTHAPPPAVDAGGQAPAALPTMPIAPLAADDGTGDALRFGRVLDGIVDAGVRVPDGQGLLLVQPAPGGSADVVITVDGADAGVAPLGVALPPGTHEVAFHHGSEVQYRFVNVHAGKTHLTAPP